MQGNGRKGEGEERKGGRERGRGGREREMEGGREGEGKGRNGGRERGTGGREREMEGGRGEWEEEKGKWREGEGEGRKGGINGWIWIEDQRTSKESIKKEGNKDIHDPQSTVRLSLFLILLLSPFPWSAYQSPEVSDYKEKIHYRV